MSLAKRHKDINHGNEEKTFTRKKSVDWYDPRQLVKSGIKALISTILGNFNDKRELQAALHHDDHKKTFRELLMKKKFGSII